MYVYIYVLCSNKGSEELQQMRSGGTRKARILSPLNSKRLGLVFCSVDWNLGLKSAFNTVGRSRQGEGALTYSVVNMERIGYFRTWLTSEIPFMTTYDLWLILLTQPKSRPL